MALNIVDRYQSLLLRKCYEVSYDWPIAMLYGLKTMVFELVNEFVLSCNYQLLSWAINFSVSHLHANDNITITT